MNRAERCEAFSKIYKVGALMTSHDMARDMNVSLATCNKFLLDSCRAGDVFKVTSCSRRPHQYRVLRKPTNGAIEPLTEYQRGNLAHGRELLTKAWI